MKRQLSVAQAVEAASILYEINTKESAVLAMAVSAGLAVDTPEQGEKLLGEWRAFVHAAVLYGLMAQAPNVVVMAYLRSTQTMLENMGYTKAEATTFVDDAFGAYVEPLLLTQTKECPALFFQRLYGCDLKAVEPRAAAMIAGAMAMLFAAVLDKLEMYEYLLD